MKDLIFVVKEISDHIYEAYCEALNTYGKGRTQIKALDACKQQARTVLQEWNKELQIEKDDEIGVVDALFSLYGPEPVPGQATRPNNSGSKSEPEEELPHIVTTRTSRRTKCLVSPEEVSQRTGTKFVPIPEYPSILISSEGIVHNCENDKPMNVRLIYNNDKYYPYLYFMRNRERFSFSLVSLVKELFGDIAAENYERKISQIEEVHNKRNNLSPKE